MQIWESHFSPNTRRLCAICRQIQVSTFAFTSPLDRCRHTYCLIFWVAVVLCFQWTSGTRPAYSFILHFMFMIEIPIASTTRVEINPEQFMKWGSSYNSQLWVCVDCAVSGTEWPAKSFPFCSNDGPSLSVKTLTFRYIDHFPACMKLPTYFIANRFHMWEFHVRVSPKRCNLGLGPYRLFIMRR